jgi:pantoate--beta-alanine ligase
LKVFQTVAELQKYLLEINGLHKQTIGFVPTMGALHEGHISLIRASKAKTDITVCSIFVNPTQFNDLSDFNRYPVRIDQDLEMLLKADCDVAFIPSFEEIYPSGTLEQADVTLGITGSSLEGAFRPGHFEGVMQVVKRLLEIVRPDMLFLGQKDFQQCMVISKLIQRYNMPVRLVVSETLREPDGLAMSSRNMRLNGAEHQAAVKLSQAIFYIRDHLAGQPLTQLIEEQKKLLSQDPLIEVEYIQAVRADTLEPLQQYDAATKAAILIAAKVGSVRLIDNVLVEQ